MSNCQKKKYPQAGTQSYLALFDWDEIVGVCQNVANLNVGSKNLDNFKILSWHVKISIDVFKIMAILYQTF